MGDTTYTIAGHVIDRDTQRGVPNVRVEAWDLEFRYPLAAGLATTDDQGTFRITFTDSYFEQIFGGRRPDLYFKVFAGYVLLASTERDVVWTIQQPDAQANILLSARQDTVYMLNGQVVDASGSGVSNLRVEAWDREFEIQNAIITATTDDQGGFRFGFTDQFLRQLFSDRNPSLFFQVFSNDERVASTEDSIIWRPYDGDFDATIQLGGSQDNSYTIDGHVFEEGTQNGVAGVRVEAWDQDHIFDSSIIAVDTNADGSYQISFSDSYLRQFFGDRTPNIFFKVFNGTTQITSTDGSISWTTAVGSTVIDLTVPRATDNAYTITCHVIESGTQNAVSGIVVEAWDQNHVIGSAIATAATDSNGNVVFHFTDSSLAQTFGGNTPRLYFNALRNGAVVASTDGSVVWTQQNGDMTVTITVPRPDNSYVVTCHVMEAETQADVPGVSVEAWDQDHVLTASIATGTTDSAGSFQFTFTDSSLAQSFGSRTPNLYFKAFLDSTLLASTDGSTSWTPADGNTTVEIYVAESDVEGGSPPTDHGCGQTTASTYSVTGTVRSTDRAGLGGLQVAIVDQGVGQYVQLATGVTDNCGNYTASFSGSQVSERGKVAPDLQARVSSASGTFIAASDIQYNASGTVVLDVLLPSNPSALPSEHASLLSALSAHYGGTLRSLQENTDRRDITYLANKSGWDARAVAMAAQADQFGSDSSAAGASVDPTFFYALFRSGMPANADTVYHTAEETLSAIWNNAADQGVISESQRGQIPQVLSSFRTLSANRLLTGPATIGPSAMRDLLSASHLTTTQQQQFASIYAANRSNTDELWSAVTETLGSTAAARLQVDGKLAFLTINNAPLVSAVHAAVGGAGVTDPLQLATGGYYDPARWSQLLTGDIPVPADIPGETDQEKRDNYADYLAAQVKVSYPTAVVASQIGNGTIRLDAGTQVQTFLTQNQGSFEIGVNPVETYIDENQIDVDDDTLDDLKRLQRVYQITPDDASMAGLLDNGLDAAAHVASYDKDQFVETFGDAVGGADTAGKIHDRAVQVHNAVLNVAISYLTASNAIPLGALPMDPSAPDSDSARQLLQPAPKGPGSAEPEDPGTPPGPYGLAGPAGTGAYTTDVIPYATLDTLFGSMDFCNCDECRSILSPAAYLVDLLYFINQTTPPPSTTNPQTVLFQRRPDIQHLPLTCENTNTALPYIDIVNETLEYYIANGSMPLSLTGYTGHDTGTMTSEDLLAMPAFVIDTAYTTLLNERFPIPLPFHRPLESLRRHFRKFDVPLTLAMERLRPNDNLERGSSPYGWRDILMEELGLSRQEYEILTNSSADPLWRIYGYASGTTDATVIADLSNAKKFSQRLEVTYEELVEILKARFVNPNADLIPKLEKLGVSFPTLKALKNGTMTDAAFDALLPTGAGAPNPAEYGGDIKLWVKDNTNYARIMSLVVLTDTTAAADPCSFDTLELRFSNPMSSPSDTSTRLSAVEYTRILRFIRLWRKLGWTVEQTDAAICSLYRTDMAQVISTDIDTITELDTGFLTLLPRLGIVVRIIRTLNLTVDRDLQPLLACWSDINISGADALYRRMFLNPSILAQDPVYADNGYGGFLTNPSVHLFDHAESLRAAFNLTGDEYDRIVTKLGFTSTNPLSIANISDLFRRGYMARILRISVRELLMLIDLTGLDPFAAPDPTAPAMLKLAALVQDMKDAGLKMSAALYLVWNQDLSGTSAPTTAQVNAFISALRDDYAKVESEFAVVDDPTGEITRARMTLVFGTDATDFFFSLLNDTFVSETPYVHYQSAFGPALSAAVLSAGGSFGSPATPRLVYDDFRKRLTFNGVMSTTQLANLLAVPGLGSVSSEVPGGQYSAFVTDFTNAINALYAANNGAVSPFFARYTELLTPFQTFTDPANVDPVEVKRSALLAAFLPALKERRKALQTVQRLADTAQTDRTFAETLIDPSPVAEGLHSSTIPADPALNDLLAMENTGLTVQFYDNDTVGTAPQVLRIDSSLTYASGSGNTLPANTINPTNAVSGIWTGNVEAQDTDYYNIYIDAEAASTVGLKIDGVTVPLTHTGVEWESASQLYLKAGTLYAVEITVEKVHNSLSVEWSTTGRGRTPIPARLLYPSSLTSIAADAYLRFLKAAALASATGLSAAEVARPKVSAVSWLNVLPTTVNVVPTTTLLAPLRDLLDFAYVKSAISPGADTLLTVMNDPAAATATSDATLYMLTGWDATSLNALVTRFVGSIANLSQPGIFRRVYDAFALMRAMGISGPALIAATTNDPTSTVMRDLQAALRARYAVEDWRLLVQPINDQMRSLQRDALVAYILHQFRSSPTTQHINTADKLFEYFLMDVEMEPCMQTSRIRHALSSVQLFIERCLMNLETRVSPAALSAQQWEWMKRYRVWEANRKVFLFPENWLEPELRDDKSPFFKEIETELLASDVTEDSASEALLNYLAKLEEVAKLEPVGFHHIPADPVARTGEVNHVVARTPGAHRKYYYRRREYGYWTAWEAIKLDIEDNPVVPVIWKDRLLLLWLKIIKKGPENASGQKPTGGSDLDHMNMPADPRMTAYAVLCWSEYYNGKWQATKSSDLEHPAPLGTFDAGGAYTLDRASLQIRTVEEGDGLRIYVTGSGNATFLMYNTHSVPSQDYPPAPSVLLLPWATTYDRMIGNYVNDFSFMYITNSLFTSTAQTKDVLHPDLPFGIVTPTHSLPDPWTAPLFYQDRRHVFYVTSGQQQITLRAYVGYGIPVTYGVGSAGIIPSVITPSVRTSTPLTWSGGVSFAADAPVSNPVAVRGFITEDANIGQALGSTSTVSYGSVQIGPGGSINVH